MINHKVELTVKSTTAEQFYDFMINPTDKGYNEWWAEEHLQFHITKKGDKNHLGDHVYFDEYLGEKRRLKFHAVVITAERPKKIIWQMKIAGMKMPFYVKLELTDIQGGVNVIHELKLGYKGIGIFFDLFIRLYFNKAYRADLEKHCKIEWQKLADYLDNYLKKVQNDIQNYICSIVIDLVKIHNIDKNKLVDIMPTIYFTPNDKFEEIIKDVDPDIEYTNEEDCKCVGKFIYKDGKYHLVISSYFINILINNNYKDVFAKYTICHELGHWITHLIKPELCPPKKPKYFESGIEMSKYAFSIFIDEYTTNNNIMYFLTSEECNEIIKDDALYKDLDNLYENIKDPNDLFVRLWGNPNSIFKNLISHIPIYKKCGGYIEDEILELINIKGIISGLEKEKPDYEGLHTHLVYVYNLIVKDYNSDIPEIMQNYLK